MIFSFTPFELDLRLFELREGESTLPVQPKVLDLLSYLIRQRDRVVSKQELLENVWPGEVVSETALTHAIMEARRAVRDDGAQQRVIQTVRRRGYRFVAPVAEGAAREAAAAVRPRALPEPDPLVGEVFVGRERPLALLHSALQESLTGRGRLALIVGEPGIGKTRLAERLAVHARSTGAEVLLGRSVEGEGAPAFWPWVQLVRAYSAPRERDELEEIMGAGRAPVIAQAIAEVREKLAPLPEPPQLEPAEARFRLFDSLSGFLRSAAARQPLVLVLDDLHHADRPSLLLLQFLVRELREAPMLIVGTYRDTALARDPAKSRILAEIVREDRSRTIQLDGLSRSDVAEFVERTTGRERTDGLVAALHEQTGGNPFFLTQVMRLLEAEGRLGPDAVVPETVPLSQGVRDAIRRHLDVLSTECQEVLATASVIGREFSLGVLAHAGGMTSEHALEALTEGLTARVVAQVPDAVGRFRFAHSLIRETLYGELPSTRRVQVHGRIGDALALAYGSRPEPHLAELAHHFVQAAPGGRIEQAVRYSALAAEYALRQLAYEQASGHYERALQVMALGEPDEPRRLSLLLALGSALWRAGEGERARQTFLDAAETARSLGRGEELARAALGFGIWDQDDIVDKHLVRLLEDALRGLGEQDSPLRARVLGRLARELKFAAPLPRLEALSQAAVEMARRTGDNTALADALVARHWALWAPADTEDRFAAAVEIVQLAEEIGNRSLALQGRQFRLADLLEMGDIAGVDLELSAISWLADELHQPQHQWFAALFRSMRAQLSGQFEEAERLAARALGIGERVHRETAVQWYGDQMGALRRALGRLEESSAALQVLRHQYPQVPTWRCEQALVLALRGFETEARAEFEQLAARDFADLRLDSTWLSCVRFLAELCARLDDTRRAELLYERLLPYAARIVSTGPGIACYGSAARYLGILATTCGRWDAARAHFETALDLHTRMAALPLIAHTERDYARLLALRGESDDRAQAAERAERAAATARELGMGPLEAESRSLLRSLERPARKPRSPVR